MCTLDCFIISQNVHDFIFPTGLDMQIMSDNENMRIVSWDSGVRANTVSFPILHTFVNSIV